MSSPNADNNICSLPGCYTPIANEDKYCVRHDPALKLPNEPAKCLVYECPGLASSSKGYCAYHLENAPPHLLKKDSDPVNHPSHYTEIVPGIECIQVVKHFSFVRGNAIKYLWRADAKGNLREDLEKAKWYIEEELRGL